jgi:GGDEF domain-containing protein
MPVVDILSAYLICGVSSLVGALLMRMARSDEPRMRAALRTFVGAFGVLGVGLLPAGLGPLAAHPAARIGVAVVGPGERLDDTLQRADEALYRAKREGRNQCRFSLKAA